MKVKKRLDMNLDNYCYFCDFNDVTPHMHHIIRKCDGGTSQKDNLIPLCANHHEGIHRRVYILMFNPKQGFYYLKNKTTNEIMPPAKRQIDNIRKLPKSSINKSNNLRIEGNLNSKGRIIIRDIEKTRSKKQREIIKKQKNLFRGVE
jgi:hypothetical protein